MLHYVLHFFFFQIRVEGKSDGMRSDIFRNGKIAGFVAEFLSKNFLIVNRGKVNSGNNSFLGKFRNNPIALGARVLV